MKGEDDVNTARKDEEADGSGEFLIFFCIQNPDCAFIFVTMNMKDRQIMDRPVAKQNPSLRQRIYFEHVYNPQIVITSKYVINNAVKQ